MSAGMRIELRDAGVGEELPPTSAVLQPGAPLALAVDTDLRPRLLALLLGGRVKPTTGAVLLDGRARPRELRRRVAVVDAPFASEPSAGVALRVVVAEELAFDGRRPSAHAIARTLDELGLADRADTAVDLLPSAARVRMLAALAARREGVEAVVVTSPERHGADPAELWPVLVALAESGTLVAVVTDAATAGRLRALGARDGRAPEPDPDPEPDPEPVPDPTAVPAEERDR